MQIGLGLSLLGWFVSLLGAAPEWLGLDRSPAVGYVQIAVFLVGLCIICTAGYIALAALWNGDPISIASDIGLRLIATGFIIAVASGMADVFGFGSSIAPEVPMFGFWQMIGVLIGEAVIGIGFLLLIPYHRTGNQPENR